MANLSKRVGQPQAALTNGNASTSQGVGQPQAALTNCGASPQRQGRAREWLDGGLTPNREALRRRVTPHSDGDDVHPPVSRTDALKNALKANLQDMRKVVQERIVWIVLRVVLCSSFNNYKNGL